MADPIIILKHETLRASLISDATSVAGAWAMILPGKFIGSTTLQVVGALIFGLWMLGRLVAVEKSARMTNPEARKRLDQIEAAQIGGAA